MCWSASITPTTRAKVEAGDLELINKAAPELNEEVEDILRYQDRALKRALALE
jgi:hypothetical protein